MSQFDDQLMNNVMVLSKKIDGSLRDEYEAFLYSFSDETAILFCPPGYPFYDYRRSAWFERQDGMIEIYSKQKWFNVWHICEQVSLVNRTYVNISLPASFDENRLEWIDLDIDYRVHLDNTVVRLDQVEFEQNIERMDYPVQLVEQVWEACREVEIGLEDQNFPFNHQEQVKLYQQIKDGL